MGIHSYLRSSRLPFLNCLYWQKFWVHPVIKQVHASKNKINSHILAFPLLTQILVSTTISCTTTVFSHIFITSYRSISRILFWLVVATAVRHHFVLLGRCLFLIFCRIRNSFFPGFVFQGNFRDDLNRGL